MAERRPRVCPNCGRQVPSAVSKCRCGAILPDPLESESSSERAPLPVFLGMLVVVAVVAYWTFTRETGVRWPEVPPPSEPVAPADATTPAAAAPTAAPGPPPPAAAPARSELSAEQRAWNAAARMSDPGKKAGAVEITEPAVLPAGSVDEVVAAAMPAMVIVETTAGRGSGFFAAADTVLTSMHVVQQAQYVTLRRADGSTVTASVHIRAPHFDIAVLKVAPAPASQTFLQMASVNDLRSGQDVIVIGAALGALQHSVFRGTVSNLRNAAGVTLIQSDAAAKPGTSGGPMLDRNGRVIGILTGGNNEQAGGTFAVSIDHAREILDGRETNLGSGASGLSNIVTTDSETGRRQAEQIFRQRIDSAEQGAAKLDEAWQRFRARCHTSPVRGSLDREWFTVFVPGAGGLPGNAAAGCAEEYQSLLAEINRFRNFMRTAVDEARRANVMPGTIRDMLRSKRLNFDY